MNTRKPGYVATAFAAVFAATLCGATGLIASTPTAEAGDRPQHRRTTLISCIGNETATWSPGLTNKVQPYLIAVDNRWSSCSIGGSPAQVSARSQAQFSVVESCAQFGVPANATWLIKWSNGATSTFKFEATVNISGGNFMITAPGTIMDGAYRGSLAIATFTLLNSAGLFTNGCDTPEGVTTVSGPSTLLIMDD